MVLVGIGLALVLLSMAFIELPLLLGFPFWLLLVWTIAWIVARRRTPRRHAAPASALPEEFRPVVWALIAIVVEFTTSLVLMLVPESRLRSLRQLIGRSEIQSVVGQLAPLSFGSPRGTNLPITCASSRPLTRLRLLPRPAAASMSTQTMRSRGV
jgi:hypothetical protein